MNHVSPKDVAAKAGVTFPTVSKVLKGKGTVSPETRITILQAAEELDYVPNAGARSLANKKTSIIGCIGGGFCDIAVVGCDDIPLSAHVFPALTTMHIPFFELGEAAARLLHDLIVQDITALQEILLPVHLVARNSSAFAITT